MKARAIDKYIRRATAGLPQLERIDTAAELRVNLNLRIKELMLEGHSREEAEFLAIKDMGDAFTTNRAFLGHVFTDKLGWILVALTLLAGAGWWLWQNRWEFFWVNTQLITVEPSTDEKLGYSEIKAGRVEQRPLEKLEFYLPRFARTVEMLYISSMTSNWFVASGRIAKETKGAILPQVLQPLKLSLLFIDSEKESNQKVVANINLFLQLSENKSSDSVFNFFNTTGTDWSAKPRGETCRWLLQNSGFNSAPIGLNKWHIVASRKLLRGVNLGNGTCKNSTSDLPSDEVVVLMRVSDVPREKLRPIEAKLKRNSVHEAPVILDKNGQPFKL